METPTKASLKKPSAQKRKRQSISFSPHLLVHEFDVASPSKRRLEYRQRNVHDIDEDQVKFELKLQGYKINDRSKVNKTHRRILEKRQNEELKSEIELYPFARDTYRPRRRFGNEKLRKRLELARVMRRRGQLRLSFGDRTPCNMSRTRLVRELTRRKVVVAQDTLQFNLICGLEQCLMKEDEGLVGNGYEFGKRNVSVDDLLAMEDDMTDRELREFLVARGVEPPKSRSKKLGMLKEMVENELDSQLNFAVQEELKSEMRKRGLSFDDDDEDSDLADNDQEGYIAPDEGDDQVVPRSPPSPKNERAALRDISHSPGYNSPVQTDDDEEPDLEALNEFNQQLFEDLFKAGTWHEDYEGDVDQIMQDSDLEEDEHTNEDSDEEDAPTDDCDDDVGYRAHDDDGVDDEEGNGTTGWLNNKGCCVM